MLALDEVASIMVDHRAVPERRQAQRVLAREITGLVHGAGALAAAEEAAEVAFGATDEVSERALESLIDEVPTARIAAGRFREGLGIVDLLVEAGVSDGKGAARRLVTQNGVTVGSTRPDPATIIGSADLRYGRFLLIRKGKRSVHLVVAN
jgi:tyrosyl-tRNA synthetase